MSAFRGIVSREQSSWCRWGDHQHCRVYMDAETLRPSRSVLTTVRRLPLIRRQRPLWIADQRYNRIFLDAETLRQREHRRIEWPTIPGTSPPSAVGNARVEYPPTRTCRFLNITIARL